MPTRSPAHNHPPNTPHRQASSLSYDQGYDPNPLSVPRLTTLFTSLLVALGSGSNYVYSAYAPQLGARLRITHTQLNVIGLAGNIGVYSTSFLWGRVVDSRGPRLPLASSFVLLLVGYSGIRLIFDQGLSPEQKYLPGFTFILMVLCEFMSGSGGSASAASAINSTAKSFPDSARATTVGLVLSGFGLSAFLFSTLSRIFFPGDTSHFLLILSLGTALPMLLGFFFVRPIPLPKSNSTTSIEEDTSLRRTSISDAGGLMGASIHAPLLQHDVLEGVEEEDLDVESSETVHELSARRRGRTATSDTAHRPGQSGFESPFLSRRRAILMGDVSLTNMFGKGLARSTDFWLLFVILSLLSGTGVMYINNVGSMSQALYAKESPIYNDVEASKWQTTQVSTISVMNCAGRIIIGLLCDYGKSRLGIPRSTSLILVSFFFFISQVAAASINTVKDLWIASALLGLAHGSVFSLFATMILEWFGMPHFSENWGYIQMAPVFAGNLFSLLFGRNLDAHETGPRHTPAPLIVSLASPRCPLGKECYVDTLYLTIGACLLGMLLSVWACLRDREKLKAAMAAAEG